MSAALVLLTGAADIYDDIIDKSKVKSTKPTAYGKFSQDAVLLAGDIYARALCYGLQNEAVKKEILKLLAGRITRKDTQKIAELVTSTEQVQALNRKTLLMARNEENALNFLRGDKTFFMLLLQLSVKTL